MSTAFKITLILGILVGIVFSISILVDEENSEQAIIQQISNAQHILLDDNSDIIEYKIQRAQKKILQYAYSTTNSKSISFNIDTTLIKDTFTLRKNGNDIESLNKNKTISPIISEQLKNKFINNNDSSIISSPAISIVDNNLIIHLSLVNNKKEEILLCFVLNENNVFKTLNDLRNNHNLVAYAIIDNNNNKIINSSNKIISKSLDNNTDSNTIAQNGLSIQSQKLIDEMLELRLVFNSSSSLDKTREFSYYVLLLGLSLTLFIIYIAVNSYSRHVLALSQIVRNFGKERNHVNISKYEKRKDEIGVLAKSFIAAQQDLDTYIENLKITEQQKQKIEQEIIVGQEIQASILGNSNHQYVIKNIQVQVFQEAAKVVGGDLYKIEDFTEDEVFFAISDISDKGVPAAILMAKLLGAINVILKSQIKDIALITSILNKELCEHNDKCMFATMLIGTINPKDNRLCIVNAGHPPPLQIITNGSIEALKGNIQPALGIMPNYEYSTQEYSLEDVLSIFTYTDGLTDTINVENEMYGEDGIFEFIENNKNFNLNDLAKHIKDYRKENDIADDLTMLKFKISKTNDI